jgi:hypothetical protein
MKPVCQSGENDSFAFSMASKPAGIHEQDFTGLLCFGFGQQS